MIQCGIEFHLVICTCGFYRYTIQFFIPTSVYLLAHLVKIPCRNFITGILPTCCKTRRRNREPYIQPFGFWKFSESKISSIIPYDTRMPRLIETDNGMHIGRLQSCRACLFQFSTIKNCHHCLFCI